MSDKIRAEELEHRWKVAQDNFNLYLGNIYSGNEQGFLYGKTRELSSYIQQLANRAREVGKHRLADDINIFSAKKMTWELARMNSVEASNKAIFNIIKRRRDVPDVELYIFDSVFIKTQLEEIGKMIGTESGMYNMLKFCIVRADLLDSEIQAKLGLISLTEPTERYNQLKEKLFQLIFEDKKRHCIYGGKVGGRYVTGDWGDEEKSIDAREETEKLSPVARRFDNPERIMELFKELGEENIRLLNQRKEGISLLDSTLTDYTIYAYMTREQRPPEETLHDAFHPVFDIEDKGIDANCNISISMCHDYTIQHLYRGSDLKTAQAKSIGSARGLMNMAEMVASGPDWPQRYAEEMKGKE